ncbi:hypothetical protein C4D60_Mb11t21130 [Musa balbisiana]|uniref:Transcription repressor n=1 Tax=Musa balbisiana TaxID=52838 RepID=A0A4S8J5R9_MUSBA|nr:hypothetical protein C4D60_Mb11t21130 [Musa balbisiana]
MEELVDTANWGLTPALFSHASRSAAKSFHDLANQLVRLMRASGRNPATAKALLLHGPLCGLKTHLKSLSHPTTTTTTTTTLFSSLFIFPLLSLPPSHPPLQIKNRLIHTPRITSLAFPFHLLGIILCVVTVAVMRKEGWKNGSGEVFLLSNSHQGLGHQFPRGTTTEVQEEKAGRSPSELPPSLSWSPPLSPLAVAAELGKTESVPDFPEVESPVRQRDYCSCRFISSPTDIIIDMDTKTSITPKPEKLDEFDSVSELRLPPIITKPATKEPEAVKFEDKDVEDKEQNKKQSMKPSPGFHRLRMRTNSPRLSSKKVQAHRSRRCTGSTTTSATAMQKRKGLSESFAVVKSSSNPHRDFKDSMLEMIVENNIRASKDLEELLACYLSLNSREYHDVIVKVFEQIWFDLTDIKL